MPIVFDPSTKRIILDSVNVTATEMYSRSADWLAISDNLKYGEVFRQVGGDDLGGGLSIPPYFFLQGAWRVRPMESDHELNVSGNLFVEGGGNPFVQTLSPHNVQIRSTVPVQAQGISTGGSVSSSGSTDGGRHTVSTDIVSPGLVYQGFAPPGSLASDAVFSIFKTIRVGGETTVTWASGLHAWNDRASLTYL